MARDLGPKCRMCRREGIKLFLKGERCLTEKCAVERRSYPPGEHGRGRIKQSQYLLQLAREAEGAAATTACSRSSSARTYEKATRGPAPRARTCCGCSRRVSTTSSTGSASPALRAQARQLVRHGHFQVNGRRVNIPSYGVRPERRRLAAAGKPGRAARA